MALNHVTGVHTLDSLRSPGASFWSSPGDTILTAFGRLAGTAGVSAEMRSSKVPGVTCSKPMLVDEDSSIGDCLAAIACL